MSFDTVDLLTGDIFQVSWDLGRRCNYDCSYCPVHRHDNFSPHATLQELKNSTDFLFKYMDTYLEHRTLKGASISFTGGEPTVNPNFIPFIEYLRKAYAEQYADRWDSSFALTSNGAMSKKMANAVIEHFHHITVSYHAESDDKLKKQVRDRILQFHEAMHSNPEGFFSVSVNVMFHAQYFDECVDLCRFLEKHNVKYVPRVIGEEPESPSDQAHRYTDAQIQWMKDYWNDKNAALNDPTPKDVQIESQHAVTQVNTEGKSEPKKLAMTIGRPCCGSREMCLSSQGDTRKSTFVNFRNFKGWHCSVNWFFLHLEQQTDSVYHHQTCQAKFDQTRGRLGKISEGDKIIDNLKAKLEAKEMPTVICPKQTCGCGLCAPKSAFKEKYFETLDRHIVDMSIFDNSKNEVSKVTPLIPGVNFEMDSDIL